MSATEQPDPFGAVEQQDPFGAAPPPSTGGASGPRAGFWRRFAAAFTDGIITGVFAGVFQFIDVSLYYVLSILIPAVYFTLLEGGPTGQTIGKRALGIRVIDLERGGPIGYSRGFIRWIGRFVSSIVILLGYFWMLWDPEKQTWHDKMAGSVVVPASVYPIA